MNTKNQILLTVLMVAGALVFGMILAGGLNLTEPTRAEETSRLTAAAEKDARDEQAGRVESHAGTAVESFADLAAAVLPAVVTVEVVRIEEAPDVRSFQDFFRRGPRQQEQEEQRFPGAGSGFLISADGWVVTNNHVVERAERIQVGMDGREYPAEVRGRDRETDLALLKIDAGTELPYLPLGDSDALRVGDWVMAIGNPLNFEASVTVGVVSAKGRSIPIENNRADFANYIQTDAAINLGNSGGPLVNTAGEVVGIATGKAFAENIGFAVPVDVLQGILPQLRDEGRVRRGYLGVSIRNLSHREARYYRLEQPDGAQVQDVVEGTPAYRAGVEAGDVILGVNDHQVVNTRDLIDYVASFPPGAEVRLRILRDFEQIELDVQLEERPSMTADQDTPGPASPRREESLDWLGLELSPLTSSLRERIQLDRRQQGVYVSGVSPRSAFAEEGFQQGFVIVGVNDAVIEDLEDLRQATAALESGDLVRIEALVPGGQRFFSVIEIP